MSDLKLVDEIGKIISAARLGTMFTEQLWRSKTPPQHPKNLQKKKGNEIVPLDGIELQIY
jgi:hypothetical protein